MNGKAFKSFGYVARARRTETRGGVEQAYWTVRCRRKIDEGEWVIGWFATERQAEHAFHVWVEKRRRRLLTPASKLTLLEIIDRYGEAVQSMNKRPNTISNRLYTAKQFGEYLTVWGADKPASDFDETAFEGYLAWLEHEREYAPQTIENALIGARTLLRWASPTYIQLPPKAPTYHVPQKDALPVYEEELEAVIEHADERLALLLRLMWENGFRFAEAASIRPCDIDARENLVTIAPRDGFQPKTTKSQRTVPIDEDLAAQLLALSSNPTERIFACGSKSAYHHWRHATRKAQDAAGVRRFRFHELRRAAADRLRRSGVSVDVYCRLMGHSEITGLRHYAVVDTDDLRKAHAAGIGAARRRDDRQMPSTATGNVVSISVAATMLDTTEAALLQLHEEGRLAAVRFGDQLLVDVGEVKRLQDSSTKLT